MAKQLQNLCILNWLSVKIINILFSRKTVPLMHTRPRTRTPCPTCPLLETAQSSPRWRVPHSASEARRAQEQVRRVSATPCVAGLSRHARRGALAASAGVAGRGPGRDPPTGTPSSEPRTTGTPLPSLGRPFGSCLPSLRGQGPGLPGPGRVGHAGGWFRPDAEPRLGGAARLRHGRPGVESSRRRESKKATQSTIMRKDFINAFGRPRQARPAVLATPRGRRGQSESPQTPPVHPSRPIRVAPDPSSPPARRYAEIRGHGDAGTRGSEETPLHAVHGPRGQPGREEPSRC